MKKPTTSINSSSNKIVTRYLQYRVKSSIDGIYGSATERCIKEYQKNNKLVADGIIGKNTWYKLLS